MIIIFVHARANPLSYYRTFVSDDRLMDSRQGGSTLRVSQPNLPYPDYTIMGLHWTA